jgi:hypothetical protein
MSPGDYVEHTVGGGRGIYIHQYRVFVYSEHWSGTVGWLAQYLRPVNEPPPDELWAAYCAYCLTK